jgi:hypothetical protein
MLPYLAHTPYRPDIVAFASEMVALTDFAVMLPRVVLNSYFAVDAFFAPNLRISPAPQWVDEHS